MKTLTQNKLTSLTVLFSCALAISSSVQAATPKEASCKKAAVNMAEKMINTLGLSIAETKISTEDANEKEVKVAKTHRYDSGSGYMTENTEWKIRYAAVNREVGFNMEGEWQVTIMVNTESSGSSEQCEIGSVSASLSLPK